MPRKIAEAWTCWKSQATGERGWRPFWRWHVLVNPRAWLNRVVNVGAILIYVGVAVVATLLVYSNLPSALEGKHENATVVIALVGAAATAPFLIWRMILKNRDTNIAQQNHITGLFTQATDRLGAVDERLTEYAPSGAVAKVTVMRKDPAPETRLGALHALERIARNSPRDHAAIYGILASYYVSRSTDPDSIAGIMALARRFDYPLAPDRSEQERLRMKRMLHSGGEHRELRFVHADLTGSQFLRLRYRSMIFESVILNDCKFDGVAKSTNAQAHFEDCTMLSAKFLECDLSGAVFRNVVAHEAAFVGCELKNARFDVYCNLEGANFSFSSLEGEFRIFTTSKLSRAQFQGAWLKGLDLTYAEGLTTDLLIEAWGDETTLLPPTVSRPKNFRWEKPLGSKALQQWVDDRNIGIASYRREKSEEGSSA